MVMHSFIIPDRPVGWQRPGQNRKMGVTFTPKRTKAYEDEVKLIYRALRVPILTGGVAVSIEIYYTPNKGTPKKYLQQHYDNDLPCFSAQKPDVDNVAKAILDGLNGEAYEDDKQVVSLLVRRLWGYHNHVKVTVGSFDGR